MARTVDPKRHAEKRQHILHHAAVLFATYGYDPTSTAQICKAAGISPGNLYHYFSSKKAIFIAIVSDEDPDDNESTQSALARCLADADPLDGVVTFVQHLASAAAASPIVPQLVIEAMLLARHDQEIADLLAQDSNVEQHGLQQLLARARSAGAIDAAIDPADAAAWLQALIGAIYLEAAHNPTFDPSRQLANLTRTVRGFLTEPGSRKAFTD